MDTLSNCQAKCGSFWTRPADKPLTRKAIAVTVQIMMYQDLHFPCVLNDVVAFLSDLESIVNILIIELGLLQIRSGDRAKKKNSIKAQPWSKVLRDPGTEKRTFSAPSMLQASILPVSIGPLDPPKHLVLGTNVLQHAHLTFTCTVRFHWLSCGQFPNPTHRLTRPAMPSDHVDALSLQAYRYLSKGARNARW